MAEAERRPGRENPRLIAIGGEAPREIPLDARKTSVGSASDNQIVIGDKSVSRHHAVIRRRLGRFRLADLESTNGTFVNGRRVRDPAVLRRGDEIRLGSVRFVFLTRAGRLSVIRAATVIPGLVLLFVVGFSVTHLYLTHRGGTGPGPAASRAVSPPSRSASATKSEVSKSAPARAEIAKIAKIDLKKSSAPAAVSAPSSAASITPPTPAPLGPQPEWLKLLNFYRAQAKLTPVNEDVKLSAGDLDHVNYLVKNLGPALRAGGNPGIDAHLEDAHKPGYTSPGAAAGMASDVDFLAFRGRKPSDPASGALSDWISGAFHRLPLLNPRLQRIGFARYCDSSLCVFALNAQTDVAQLPGGPRLYDAPVEFPAPDSTTAMRTFINEWPDPLSACRGYSSPSGLPITLALGKRAPVGLDSYTVTRVVDSSGATEDVPACGFDSSSYTNSDSATQSTGRGALSASGAVVVIPRDPLIKGASYKVSLVVNGKQYNWKFSVAR